mgnify:CR=1 FL=1
MTFSGPIDFKPKLISAMRDYSFSRFKTDLIAGIVVGIVALPLAVAFAIASGVSPTVGLITAIIGGIGRLFRADWRTNWSIYYYSVWNY